MNDDTISRQAAINAVMDEFKRVPTTAIRAKKRLESLPAAQPDLSSYSDKLWRAAYERGKAEAQPQRMRGHWRVTPMACYGGGTLTELECSECEEHQITTSNFCPNCGSYNGGEE